MSQQILTPDILSAALQGLEAQRDRINSQIAEVKRIMHRDSSHTASTAPARFEAPRPRRKLSASARERIAEAQKKRWAAFHKKAEPAAERAQKAKKAIAPTAPRRKRKLSATGRRAIADAAKGRWAELRKDKKSGAAQKTGTRKAAVKNALAKPRRAAAKPASTKMPGRVTTTGGAPAIPASE